MAIPQIDPARAKQRLDEKDGSLYLDVRSVEEFESGHVPGAWNVPLLHLDAPTRQMRPNPDFLEVVRAVVPAGTRLLVGCQSGRRSQMACEHLAAAGYTDVANVEGGFSGVRDPFGRLVAPGWQQSGFPVSMDADKGSYAALLEKSGRPRQG